MIAAAMATGADTEMFVVHSSIFDGCLSVVDGFRYCSPHCCTSAEVLKTYGSAVGRSGVLITIPDMEEMVVLEVWGER